MIRCQFQRQFTGLGGLSVFMSLLCGCSQHESSGGHSAAEQVVKVIVGTPVKQLVTDYVDNTGRTEAVETVDVRARVSGYLTKVEFMGSLDLEVKEGDLLFEIDDRPFKNSLASAEGRLASAKASLMTSSAEFERTEGLFKQGTLVKADFDRDLGRKLQGEADIMGANAGIAQATLDLEFTRITAPIAGHISKPNLTVGNLVTPLSPALTTIVSVDPIYVYFDLDEPTMLKIQRNIREGKLASRDEHKYEVLMGLINDQDYIHKGRLDFIDNRVNPNTGTIRVRGVFENPKPERGSRALTPGLFARIRVPLGKSRDALLITERAVVRNQGKTYVYVVSSDGKVESRSITPGGSHGSLRIVEAGLQEGDRVVINGLQRVRPGIKVEAIDKPMSDVEKP